MPPSRTIINYSSKDKYGQNGTEKTHNSKDGNLMAEPGRENTSARGNRSKWKS